MKRDYFYIIIIGYLIYSFYGNIGSEQIQYSLKNKFVKFVENLNSINPLTNHNNTLLEIANEFAVAGERLDNRALILKNEKVNNNYQSWNDFVENTRNVSKNWKGLSRKVNKLIFTEQSANKLFINNIKIILDCISSPDKQECTKETINFYLKRIVSKYKKLKEVYEEIKVNYQGIISETEDLQHHASSEVQEQLSKIKVENEGWSKSKKTAVYGLSFLTFAIPGVKESALAITTAKGIFGTAIAGTYHAHDYFVMAPEQIKTYQQIAEKFQVSSEYLDVVIKIMERYDGLLDAIINSIDDVSTDVKDTEIFIKQIKYSEKNGKLFSEFKLLMKQIIFSLENTNKKYDIWKAASNAQIQINNVNMI